MKKGIHNQEVFDNRIKIGGLIISVIGIIVAAFLLWETHKQVLVSQKEAKSSDSISNVSLRISDSLANAAKKSADIADSAFLDNKKNQKFYQMSVRNENRAYLAISFIKANTYKLDSLITLTFTVQNLGRTPAYLVHAKGLIDFKASQNLVAFKNLTDVGYSKTLDVTIGASQLGYPSITSTFRLTKYKQEVINNNTYHLYVAIELTYDDIFGNHHFTHGFFVYLPKIPDFNICTGYNNAD